MSGPEVNFIVHVTAASEYSRLALVGNIPELGSWQLDKAVKLNYCDGDGKLTARVALVRSTEILGSDF